MDHDGEVEEPQGSPEDTPLSAVLADLAAAGFEGQMRALEGGEVECLTCHSAFDATQIDGEAAVRLEGASDPADMLLVLPVTCPACSTQGTLVANHGPEAQVEDADVLRRVDQP